MPYDHARFPFSDWALDRVRAHGVPAASLTELHAHLDPAALFALTKQLCADTRRPDFERLVRAFVREEVAPKGQLVAPLAVQRLLNVRVMPPDRLQAIFPFHTGLLYGHGPASRSLWLPLTDVRAPADASASMHIIGLERSRALLAEATAARMSVPEMTALFARHSHALSAGPGEMVFFSQEHIHGNVLNVTGKTRVSVDFRVAEGRFGDRLARKPVGGYFAPLPEVDIDGEAHDPEQTELSAPRPGSGAAPTPARRTVLYLSNAAPRVAGAPVHLQRYMVLDYCRRNAVDFDFELFELDDLAWLPTLRHVAEGLGADVVLYSVFSLPPDRADRDGILDAFAARGATMHFVNEDMRLATPADRAALDALLAFARY